MRQRPEFPALPHAVSRQLWTGKGSGAQVEVRVQQDIAADLRGFPEVAQALGGGIQHSVVNEREPGGQRDQPDGCAGRQQDNL